MQKLDFELPPEPDFVSFSLFPTRLLSCYPIMAFPFSSKPDEGK